jgi:hypothetical protein
MTKSLVAFCSFVKLCKPTVIYTVLSFLCRSYLSKLSLLLLRGDQSISSRNSYCLQQIGFKLPNYTTFSLSVSSFLKYNLKSRAIVYLFFFESVLLQNLSFFTVEISMIFLNSFILRIWSLLQCVLTAHVGIIYVWIALINGV